MAAVLGEASLLLTLVAQGTGDVASGALGAALHFVADGALLCQLLMVTLFCGCMQHINHKSRWSCHVQVIRQRSPILRTDDKRCHFVSQAAAEFATVVQCAVSRLQFVFTAVPCQQQPAGVQVADSHQQMAAVLGEASLLLTLVAQGTGDVASGALGAGAPLLLLMVLFLQLLMVTLFCFPRR